jgi:hypothetical protein
MFIIIKLTFCTCFLTPCVYNTEYCLTKIWKYGYLPDGRRIGTPTPSTPWPASSTGYGNIWGPPCSPLPSTIPERIQLQLAEDPPHRFVPESQSPSSSSSPPRSAMPYCLSRTNMTGLPTPVLSLFRPSDRGPHHREVQGCHSMPSHSAPASWLPAYTLQVCWL